MDTKEVKAELGLGDEALARLGVEWTGRYCEKHPRTKVYLCDDVEVCGQCKIDEDVEHQEAAVMMRTGKLVDSKGKYNREEVRPAMKPKKEEPIMKDRQYKD